MTPLRKLRQMARVMSRDLRDRSVSLRAGSLDLADNAALAGLLGLPLRYLPGPRIAGFVGWGRRNSGRWAARRATNSGLLMYLAEDGFFRGPTPDAPALSFVIDGQGIYYDATRQSDLEALIAEPLIPSETARARAYIAAWRENPVTKYNALPDHAGDLPQRYVLLADQVPADLSIRLGRASAASFAQMLDAALAEWPDHTILVKTHPAARSGHLPVLPARAVALSSPCHPHRLLTGASAVYTVTSQLGFEALLAGRLVRTFGMPFYAGWGLTTDTQTAPDRRGPATLEQLVHAALIRYCRNIDPATGQEITAEQHLRAMQALRSP